METFKIRTYGRTELAQLYSPGLCPQAAFRKLNQWIDFHPTLRHELHALVPSDRVRTYTPAQVRLILEAMGEPDVKLRHESTERSAGMRNVRVRIPKGQLFDC